MTTKKYNEEETKNIENYTLESESHSFKLKFGPQFLGGNLQKEEYLYDLKKEHLTFIESRLISVSEGKLFSRESFLIGDAREVSNLEKKLNISGEEI